MGLVMPGLDDAARADLAPRRIGLLARALFTPSHHGDPAEIEELRQNERRDSQCNDGPKAEPCQRANHAKHRDKRQKARDEG